MARGWESKSVESQIESSDHKPTAPGQELSPEERNRERQHQTLLLSRAYVLQQIDSSTNDRYTASLRRALQEIEEKLGRTS